MIDLKAKSHEIKPTVWIGRKGLDENLFEEIKKQLKTKELVKVKILRAAIDEADIDRKTAPEEIAKKVGAKLIQKIGFMFSLYKKKPVKKNVFVRK